LGTRWFGYELVVGTSWSGYKLILGTSWLGYELAWYDLVRVRVDRHPFPPVPAHLSPIRTRAVTVSTFDIYDSAAVHSRKHVHCRVTGQNVVSQSPRNAAIIQLLPLDAMRKSTVAVGRCLSLRHTRV